MKHNRKFIRPLRQILIIFSVIAILFPSTSASALDTLFFSSNDVLFYRPGSACSTGTEPIAGSANVPAYSNPVYKGSAPDPSVVQGDDGKYYVYATGGTLLESADLVNWKEISNNWKMSGAPNEANGQRWAPDVTKVDSKYVLTYTIPTGTKEFASGGNPQIAYAVGDTAGGPFTYKGKLSLPYAFSIDSHIFVDDDGKIWLFYGGGIINLIQLSFDGNTLKTVGSSKQLLTKGSVGSSATIEGAFVVKRNGWYYLMYSQGHYSINEGAPDYRVVVARSNKVDGQYTPNTSMKPILEGKSPIVFPGHHSVATDSSGNDWMVYHGYFNGNRSTRSMNIDRISYDSGWPVVNDGNGPSSGQQAGSGGATATPIAATSADTCCEVSGAAPASTTLEGNDNKEKIWNYLIGQVGLNDIQAAGVMGNIKQESNFDPKALNPSSGAYGIVQWLGGRKTNLENFTKARNLPASDLGAQLDFMKKELNEGYKDSVLAPLKSATTLKEAADIWLRHFEIPCSNEACFVSELNDTRLPNSESIFQEYTGNTPPTGTGTASAGAGDCSGAGPGTDYSVDGMTIYNQEDPRWASDVYGYASDGSPATIGSSGCGPTAMATIITALSGKKVTPDQTTAYAKSKDMYVPGVGSSHDVASVLAKQWGLKSKNVSNSVDAINAELRSGGLVITSGTGGAPFTSAGHYIAIRGVTESGKWKIADSNGTIGQENSTKEWDPTQILGTANAGNIVVIYK